jgi:DNA-binding transcriptional ArsR family regulator
LTALASGGPATATDLAGRLPITRQAIAKHLALLAEAGLVRPEPGERRRVLPGAAAAVFRRARSGGGVRAVPLFIGSYLAVRALAPRAAVDVPVALAITGLGIWIILAPSSVPGLTPPM